MSEKTPTTVQRPKSIWSRKMKLDLKPLLKAATKAATHAATLKFEELGNDAAEAVASLGIETPLGELAYSLIHRSLAQAIVELTTESISHFDSAHHEAKIVKDLDFELVKIDFTVSKDFFKSPHNQEFVLRISEVYQQWLCDFGVAPSSAETIAARLPTYFVFSLTAEWRKNADTYKRLLEASDGPFQLAETALKGWRQYFAFLNRRVAENIFDEPFGLAQIYVPLNAYYVDRQSSSDQKSIGFRSKDKKVCVNLSQELISWIKKEDRYDALRVISGGPGSGKSSFTRMFCCEVAELGLAKPIYIPLHLIDPTRDVATEVERFVRDEGLIGFNPLDSDRLESGILLVFDGLDELASLGKVAAQVARDFIQAVERLIERRNLGPAPILVLLSGREVIVQENETEFRRPKQVLNILPYLVADDKSSFVDPKSLLDIDLRDAWWKNYGRLLGEKFDGIPKALKISEIDEITAQPLLNYLVALSFRRGKLDFSRRLNLNSVYSDLVAAVHERGYEKTRTYRPIGHVALKDFVRVLEEIGLAAWHGSDGRSTSVRDILSHCRQSGLEAMLQSFTEGAQAGVTKLLAAFFFRRHGEAAGEDATFVFTHKSFGEYLSATRLVRGLDRIVLDRARRRASPDDGQDIADALVSWTKLGGPAALTENVQLFLRREILQKETTQLEDWHDILVELVGFSIENSLPLERIGNLSYNSCARHEINAITSLFVALNATSVALQRVAKLKFASETSFGTFLRRVCPQRSGAQSPLIFGALSFLDLSDQCLDMADLYSADLHCTLFINARLHFANLDMANLHSTDFTNATMTWSRMQAADIEGTKFVHAKLDQVRFGGMRYSTRPISDADFTGADLREATFTGLELVNCDFSGAKLSASDINKCKKVQNCTFSGAVISEEDKSIAQWASRATASGAIQGQLLIVSADSQEVFSRER